MRHSPMMIIFVRERKLAGMTSWRRHTRQQPAVKNCLVDGDFSEGKKANIHHTLSKPQQTQSQSQQRSQQIIYYNNFTGV